MRNGRSFMRRIVFRDAYDPLMRVNPTWREGDAPSLLLSFHRGAEDQVMSLFDVSHGKLQLVQRLEADGIDIVDEGSQDGNGDLRLFDGLPLAYRCFSWSLNLRLFIQHSCRSLPVGH